MRRRSYNKTMEKPEFLESKYPDMPGSKPVERAVKKARRDPERQFAPHKRDERIQAYLDRIDRIIEDERGWELLKNKIVREFVIDTKDEDTLTKIAHGLYESEKKLAIEQGRSAEIAQLEGGVEGADILERYKGLAEEKRDIQERTLNSWLDYLHGDDTQYPTWFRYFVMRNLQRMGTLDKEKGEYSKRTDSTIAPFPELNSEALAFVYRMLTTGIGHQEFIDEPQKKEELEKLIEKKDFIKLYTFAQIETAGALNRESLQGEWVLYPQGSDHHALEDTLKGKGTGWCTAEGDAYSQLQGGDFYVYYTRGKGGKYSEPRVAIRMEGGQVKEVRGVNHRQELEPALIDVATEKYHSLPGGDKFDKKSEDMKKVTELVKKQEKGGLFTKEDLVFLYELNSSIEGFGYDKDPRVLELRKNRNIIEDLPILFECTPDEIAYDKESISDGTKAYIGAWTPEVYGLLPHSVEHVYESFPDKKVFRRTIELNPELTDSQTTERILENEGYEIYNYARDILQKIVFSKEGHKYNLVSFSVGALGFNSGATTAEIYEKAQELGLELCPAEIGPQLRLQYKDRLTNEWLLIAMEPISGSDGNPNVFRLARYSGGSWLYADIAGSTRRWYPGNRFVFASRK
jgi:hypothetical protein